MDRIVLGVDDSQGSTAAVAWCASHLDPAHTEVLAVHAIAPVVALVPPTGLPGPATLEPDARAALEAHLAGRCAPLTAAGLTVVPEIVEQPAATGLATAATEAHATMIVVGRRGEHRSIAGVLGSVPRRLAQHAPCPLLIIPEVGPR
jgi:nucleotide-binding universal stress UspA family protein